MTRTLGVHFESTGLYDEVRYKPDCGPDGRTRAIPPVPVQRVMIQRRLQAVERGVQSILNFARVGAGRGALCIEEDVDELFKAILPAGGFSTLIEPGEAVQFEMSEELAACPWEMLEERFYQCELNPEHFSVQRNAAEPPPKFCGEDGGRILDVRVKLGIGRGLSFEVRPTEPRVAPAGREFIAVIDPGSDLLGSQADNAGRAGEIHDELLRLLADHYDLEVLSRHTATADAILQAVKQKNLAGIYYFGHGGAPKGKLDGWLNAENLEVVASDLRAAMSDARLVFLNACLGASTNFEWDSELRGSVAHALAEGTRKAVVGTLWPVMNVQASRAALTFFREYLEAGKTVGNALSTVRRESHDLYRSGVADTIWMSYRLLGDATIKAWPDPEPTGDRRLKMDSSRFDFDIDEVFAYAVERRDRQHRARLALLDLVAGLARAGDLFRYLCTRCGTDPTRLFRRLLLLSRASPPARPGATPPSEDEETGRLDWSRMEKDAALMNVLERAAGIDPETGVTERRLIECLFSRVQPAAVWLAGLETVLPQPIEMFRQMKTSVGQVVDENGRVLLESLDAGGRKVIDAAHVLAQQRGVDPIPNRLLLAAFLTDPDGCAARAVEEVGGVPEDLRRLLISSTKGGVPRTFGLSHEVCARIVTPVMEHARDLASADEHGAVTEVVLFRAFVHVTEPDFKNALRRLDVPVDLDQLAVLAGGAGEEHTRPPPASPRADSGEHAEFDSRAMSRHEFTASVWDIVKEAVRHTREQGQEAVLSPHLFAGMIGDGNGVTGMRIRDQGISLSALKEGVLDLVKEADPQSEPKEWPAFSSHCADILARSLEFARRGNRRVANETDLLEAFFADGGGIVGKFLKESGFDRI